MTEIVLGFGFTLVGSHANPSNRCPVVLRYTPALIVSVTENGLGIGAPLVGSLAKPPRRFRVVLCYTQAVVVHGTETELGIGVPLLGKLLKYSYRCCVVATMIGLASHRKVGSVGSHASNKQGNGHKTYGNFLASHTFIPSDVSDYQVMGEGSKGGQTGHSGLTEGVLAFPSLKNLLGRVCSPCECRQFGLRHENW